MPRGWGDPLRLVTALVLGAVLLLAAVPAYYLVFEPDRLGEPVQVPGEALQLAEGAGRSRDGALWIDNLSSRGTALAIHGGLYLAAGDYPLLQWQLENLSPGMGVRFLWARDDTPDQIRFLDLEQPVGEASLEGVPDWQGRIIGIGIQVQGRLFRPLGIRHLELHQPEQNVPMLLERLWRDWTAFEGWWLHSVNFVVGGPRQTLLAPVPAAALWVGLSAVLFLVLQRLSRRTLHPLHFGLLFLAGWLVLDLRWQVDMLRQLELTEQRYAGMSWQEKRAADADGDLFRFIERVKGVLPEEPARVLLLGERDEDRGYQVLRAHYHLLGHNVFSGLGAPPAGDALRSGDYLLLLKPQSGTIDNGWRRALARLPLESVLNDVQGRLYRVR